MTDTSAAPQTQTDGEGPLVEPEGVNAGSADLVAEASHAGADVHGGGQPHDGGRAPAPGTVPPGGRRGEGPQDAGPDTAEPELAGTVGSDRADIGQDAAESGQDVGSAG